MLPFHNKRDLDILTRCVRCHNKFDKKSVEDIYCSKECEEQVNKLKCRTCEKFFEKAYTCAQCSIGFYCSRKCQKVDWKKDHKKTCRVEVGKRERGETTERPEIPENIKMITRCYCCNNQMKIEYEKEELFVDKKYCSDECEEEFEKNKHNKCKGCNKFGKDFGVCVYCEIGYYCSKECETNDWNEIHKVTCTGKKKRKKVKPKMEFDEDTEIIIEEDEEVEDKNFEYMYKINENTWVQLQDIPKVSSLNSDGNIDFFAHPNFDLFFRYASLKEGVVHCELSVIQIYIRLKGIYQKFREDLWNAKIPPRESLQGKSLPICVQAVLYDKKLKRPMAAICSHYGIIDDIAVDRGTLSNTRELKWRTMPVWGSSHKFMKDGTCTLGIQIGKDTRTRTDRKYLLVLQICADHCKQYEGHCKKHDIRASRRFAVFEIIKPFDEKANIIRRERGQEEVEKILAELEPPSKKDDKESHTMENKEPPKKDDEDDN